jgi:hypothetical protein
VARSSRRSSSAETSMRESASMGAAWGPEGGPGRRRPVGNPRSPPVRGVGTWRGEERMRRRGELERRWRWGSRVRRLGIKNVRGGGCCPLRVTASCRLGRH